MSRRLVTWAVILATGVAGAAVAVIASSQERSSTPPEGGSAARQPADAPAAAEGCTAGEIRAVAVRLLRSYNAADKAGLRRVLADPGDFRWFTVEDRAHGETFGAYNPRAVLSYAARRHRAHDRLRLVSFTFNGHNASFGHFEFEVLRSADDLAPIRYSGKGAALCTVEPPVIAVWAMGREGT